MNRCVRSLLLVVGVLVEAAFAGSALAASSSGDRELLKYCVPVQKIDLYPFRPLQSGAELNYLLVLTRSYISTNSHEPGLLSKWEFSPDGKTLRGEVSPTATWTDGTPLSAREAALGIAKGMQFRTIGDRVRVKGDAALKSADWASVNVDGITILDNRHFELVFETVMNNASGAIREALSTNSRQNRLWPARLGFVNGTGYGSKFDLISKFPLASVDASVDLTVQSGGRTIVFQPSSRCTSGDFYVYAESIKEPLDRFSADHPHDSQAIIGVINGRNSDLKSLQSRQALASWLINAFAKAKASDPAQPSYSHFHDGEPGSSPDGVNWKSYLGMNHHIRLTEIRWSSNNPLTPNHPLRRLISDYGKATGVRTVYSNIDFSSSQSSAHFLIDSARVERGRQVWMQDITAAKMYLPFISSFSKTMYALKTITKRSASTVPADNVTLHGFDVAARDDISIIPLARSDIPTYSRLTSPVALISTNEDELTFATREVQK